MWYSVVCTLFYNGMSNNSGENVASGVHNINVKEMYLRAEKGISWHIDASSIVWTLTFNDKSASQIARLAEIGVKNALFNE